MRISLVAALALAAGLVAAGCGNDAGTAETPEPVDVTDAPATPTPTAPRTTIEVSPENATIEWIGTKDEGKHDGGFRKLGGTCTFDPADLTTTRFTLEIDTTSLWSDAEKLTNHLKSADFFEVNEFPTAEFETTSIAAADGGEGGYTVTGELTLHGVTKTISFPATISFEGGTLDVAAEFTIDRFDYGIEYGKGKVHDLVTIKASFSGTP